MFKTVSFIIAISLAFVAVSCLDSAVETEQRTPEIEAAELSQILNNIIADGFDIDTTDLGVYYVIHEVGPDSLPRTQAGDTCYLEYSGYLLDGTEFDNSSDHFVDGIWEFIYLDIQLIPGFDDGIALMNKGTEIDLIIPSELAYGAYGSGIIAPYTTIMFSAKMHDLKPKAD